MLSMLMTTEYAPAEDRHELQQLLLHIAGGERDALAELYQRTRTAVYGLALSYLKNAQDAQDLTQDVYVQVWDCAAQYRPTGSPMGWLLAVCRSLCLMRHAARGTPHRTLGRGMGRHSRAGVRTGCGRARPLAARAGKSWRRGAAHRAAPRGHGYEAPGDRGAAGAAASYRPVEISQSIEKDAQLSGRR